MPSAAASAQQEKNKKHPKQTNKRTPPKPTLRCLGHGPAVSQGSRGGCEPPSLPQPPPRVPPSSPLPSPGLYPSCLSAHWRYQKFQIFKAVSAFSVYMLGFFNDSWPDKVQHLPHTDIGPFPVLGISVFCWSNSDSNFKMFSAAMSWQDSTSFPIPWLIRGG